MWSFKKIVGPAWATGRFDLKALWAEKGNEHGDEKGCEIGDEKGEEKENQKGDEKR